MDLIVKAHIPDAEITQSRLLNSVGIIENLKNPVPTEYSVKFGGGIYSFFLVKYNMIGC